MADTAYSLPDSLKKILPLVCSVEVKRFYVYYSRHVFNVSIRLEAKLQSNIKNTLHTTRFDGVRVSADNEPIWIKS